MDLEERGISWLCTVYEVRFCNLNPVIGLVLIFLLSVYAGVYAGPFSWKCLAYAGVYAEPIYPSIYCLFKCSHSKMGFPIFPPKWCHRTSGFFYPYINSYLQFFFPVSPCILVNLVLIMASKNPIPDLASHPALSEDILPLVTKPVIPITAPPVPSGPTARLQWLLDINKQFFQWELK